MSIELAMKGDVRPTVTQAGKARAAIRCVQGRQMNRRNFGQHMRHLTYVQNDIGSPTREFSNAGEDDEACLKYSEEAMSRE